MPLFLASDMKDPRSIEKLKDIIGPDYQRKELVYIPTASNGNHKYGAWKLGESIKIAKANFPNIKVVELEDIDIQRGETLKDVMGKPDILWVAGGAPSYLLYWMYRRNFYDYLEYLLNFGTVYVGSSAGSMVCGPSIYLAEIYPGKQEIGARLLPGLNLINFEIWPHYDKATPIIKKQVEKLWNKEKQLLLLDDGDVLFVVNGIKKLLGEEKYLKK
jgi:dipeptidase E